MIDVGRLYPTNTSVAIEDDDGSKEVMFTVWNDDHTEVIGQVHAYDLHGTLCVTVMYPEDEDESQAEDDWDEDESPVASPALQHTIRPPTDAPTVARCRIRPHCRSPPG